jgi:AcrR family transcriptional regulator
MGKGQQTQITILDTAVQIASTEGLEGLSIGTLAQTLEMSKSGVFAHFGSKEDLQTATLDHAWTIMSTYLHPTNDRAASQPLRDLLEGWLRYLEHSPFAGGCVFIAASTEFDSRPGRVRDHLVQIVSRAVQALHEQLAQAQGRGQLRADVPIAQMAFELHAFLQAAHNAYQLSREPAYFEFARHAINERLESWATKEPQ